MKSKRLSSLLGDRRGAIGVVIGATLPVMLGSVGLAVDVAQWTLAKRSLQRQADSAALAGVYGLSQGADAQASVTRDLALNARYSLDGPPIIERGPSAGPYAGDGRAVRVALATVLNLPFAGMFITGGARITAESTAALVPTGDVCVLALENTDTAGIFMGGNTTVDMNCAMVTNSVAANAVDTGGSSTVIASPIVASGGIAPSDNYADGTVLLPYSLAQLDPYADLPDPVVPAGNSKMDVKPKQSRTYNPGTYTSVDIKGTATLNPGVYYIDGGEFSVGSQAVLNAQGVTIILTSRTAASNPGSVAGVNINGGATLNMTAPTTGTYQGVLFYQDRLDTNQSHKINGNSASTLQGAIYFPSSTIDFLGTTGMNIACVQLVARQLTFSGNSKITNVCPSGQGSKAFAGYAVRLVA
ncbi:MAG: pilus assembly protein TadG-related protein [Polymorphobacter sp.]|uniref:pilus assembly protein TadG-related protein n=1 Tax=Polymorphobacter sp. TaxID=1909290 RepID=UPI003A89A0C7